LGIPRKIKKKKVAAVSSTAFSFISLYLDQSLLGGDFPDLENQGSGLQQFVTSV
jgi:hypothetical protein